MFSPVVSFMSEGLYAPSPKADCVKHHVKQVHLLVLPRSHRYFKSGLLDTLAIPIIGFALQGMPLPPGDPIDPSIQKRNRLYTLSLRSTPEVERRGLGEGQADTPINRLHLGEVPPIRACFQDKSDYGSSHSLSGRAINRALLYAISSVKTVEPRYTSCSRAMTNAKSAFSGVIKQSGNSNCIRFL